MAFRHSPITTEELRARLHNGIVKFAFIKLDGTLREANGTLNLSNIPASSHPNGNGSPTTTALRFFDFNAEGWRSLRIGTHLFVFD